VGPVAYRTLVNYLSLGISHPEKFATQDQKLLTEMVTAARGEFAKQQAKTPVNVAIESKLELLWAAYEKTVTTKTDGKAAAQFDAILAKPEVQKLERDRPEAFAELKELAAGLRRAAGQMPSR